MNIESQILKAEEESLSRKDIMDRLNKWIGACDEEAWLEEYNHVVLGYLLWAYNDQILSIAYALVTLTNLPACIFIENYMVP